MKPKFDSARNLVAFSSLKLTENKKEMGAAVKERKHNDFSHYLSCVTSNQP